MAVYVVTSSVVGDSIARGVGSTNGGGWRPGIRAASKTAGLPIFFEGQTIDAVPVDDDPWHDATPGITIAGSPGADLSSLVATYVGLVQPDIAVLEGGTNDIGTSGFTAAQTVTAWSTYLDRCWAASSKQNWFRIVLLMITPRFDAFGPTVAACNLLLPAMVAGKSYASRVTMIDSTSTLTDADLVAHLHPNDVGYAKLVALYAPVVIAVGQAARVARI